MTKRDTVRIYQRKSDADTKRGKIRQLRRQIDGIEREINRLQAEIEDEEMQHASPST